MIRCIVKLLITIQQIFVEVQLKKETLKNFFWVPEFGCPNWYTSLQNSLDMSLHEIHRGSVTHIMLQKNYILEYNSPNWYTILQNSLVMLLHEIHRGSVTLMLQKKLYFRI